MGEFKGRALIVYHSYGGNTSALADLIKENLLEEGYEVKITKAKDLNRSKNYEKLFEYDMLILGSNTWGDGEMPEPMWKVIREIQKEENEGRLLNTITGVFGTGESSYVNYCASVEIMRDIIRSISNLAVTLKIEQLYSVRDIERIMKFTNLLETRYAVSKGEIDSYEKAE